MSGNVWEWNWDWYGTYPTGTQPDFTGAASGTTRVIRSGCFGDSAYDCTVALRYYFYPYTQNGYIGFRVVRR